MVSDTDNFVDTLLLADKMSDLSELAETTLSLLELATTPLSIELDKLSLFSSSAKEIWIISLSSLFDLLLLDKTESEG